MSFDPEFLELMPHTVQVFGWMSADKYGDPTYSTVSTSYQCLIQEKYRRVTNFEGEDVVANTVVQVASTTPLDATARYVLNTGSTTVEPVLASIDRAYDEDGLHHHTLYFGGK